MASLDPDNEPEDLIRATGSGTNLSADEADAPEDSPKRRNNKCRRGGVMCGTYVCVGPWSRAPIK